MQEIISCWQHETLFSFNAVWVCYIPMGTCSIKGSMRKRLLMNHTQSTAACAPATVAHDEWSAALVKGRVGIGGVGGGGRGKCCSFAPHFGRKRLKCLKGTESDFEPLQPFCSIKTHRNFQLYLGPSWLLSSSCTRGGLRKSETTPRVLGGW